MERFSKMEYLFLWKVIIVLTKVFTVCYGKIESCPDKFFQADATTCLHIANPSANPMDAYCDGHRAHVFGRPLTDELSESILEQMLKIVEDWIPEKAYIGLLNDAEYDAYKQQSTEWHYEGQEDAQFSQDDYRLWFKRPSAGEHCATVGEGSEFKANPYTCNQENLPYVCERDDKPCYVEDVPYIEYRGLCLFVSKDETTHSFARSSCKDGHLMHLKEEQNVASLKQAFFNTRFKGGVYIGLNKTMSGWNYNNGDKETSGWESDDANAFNCGGLRIMEDMESLGLYSIPCDNHRLHFMCEITYGGNFMEDSTVVVDVLC